MDPKQDIVLNTTFRNLTQKRKLFLFLYFIFFTSAIILGFIYLMTISKPNTIQPQIDSRKVTDQVKPAVVVTESNSTADQDEISWVNGTSHVNNNLEDILVEFDYPKGSNISLLSKDIRFEPLKIVNKYFKATLMVPYENYPQTLAYDEIVELDNIPHLLKVYRLKNGDNYSYTTNIANENCIIMGDFIKAPCGMKLVFPLVQKNADGSTNFPFQFVCEADLQNLYVCDAMIERISVKYMEKVLPLSFIEVKENVFLTAYQQSGSRNNITWTLPYEYQKYEYSYKVLWSKKRNLDAFNLPADSKSYIVSAGSRYSPIYAFDGTGTYYSKICIFKQSGVCVAQSNELEIQLERKEPALTSIKLNYDKSTQTLNWETDGYSLNGLKLVASEGHVPNDGIPDMSYTYIDIFDETQRSYRFESPGLNLKYARICALGDFEISSTRCGSIASNEVDL